MEEASLAEGNIHTFFLSLLYTYLHILADNPFLPYYLLNSFIWHVLVPLTLKFAKWDRKLRWEGTAEEKELSSRDPDSDLDTIAYEI